MNEEKIKKGVSLIIEGLGYNLNDENLKDTPKRVVKFWKEFLSQKIKEEDFVHFSSVMDDLVIARNIETYSFCPHHLLPVKYNVSVAYIPHGEVVGLSKLSRIVMDEASKLVLQEDFTKKIADRLVELTKSPDVMVVVEGRHFCMIMRGVKQRNVSVITSAIRGRFRKMDLRNETLHLINSE